MSVAIIYDWSHRSDDAYGIAPLMQCAWSPRRVSALMVQQHEAKEGIVMFHGVERAASAEASRVADRVWTEHDIRMMMAIIHLAFCFLCQANCARAVCGWRKSLVLPRVIPLVHSSIIITPVAPPCGLCSLSSMPMLD